MKFKKHLLSFFSLFIFCSLVAQKDGDKDISSLFQETQAALHPPESVKLGFELLQRSREANDQDKIKYALYRIAIGYYGLGQHTKAISFCNKAIAESGSVSYFSKIYVTRVKSFVFQDLGMTDKSVSENKKAFEMASQIKEKNTDYYHIIIGLLCRDKGIYQTETDSILKYDRRNLSEFLKLKRIYKGSKNLSLPYNNVGYDYLLKKKLDSALYNYQKAEYLATIANDEFNLGFVYQSYGEYYTEVRKPDSALLYYKESLKIAEKFKEYRLAQAVTDYVS